MLELLTDPQIWVAFLTLTALITRSKAPTERLLANIRMRKRSAKPVHLHSAYETSSAQEKPH